MKWIGLLLIVLSMVSCHTGRQSVIERQERSFSVDTMASERSVSVMNDVLGHVALEIDSPVITMAVPQMGNVVIKGARTLIKADVSDRSVRSDSVSVRSWHVATDTVSVLERHERQVDVSSHESLWILAVFLCILLVYVIRSFVGK